MLRGQRAVRPAPPAWSQTCPFFAPVVEFDAGRHFPGNKTLRLMNRDAQMAVVAARLALQDAGIVPGASYPAENVALYGATGLSGMPPAEIANLLRSAAAVDGSLDLRRLGQVALRRIRPVLSFKILANMPICFVSIFENIRGPNAVYTPWEGQGAQAIIAGIRSVAEGNAPCALVGACDVKTHSLAWLSLKQLGLLDSWRRQGMGNIPGEGAAFLVLEQREHAVRRGARIHAILGRYAIQSVWAQAGLTETLANVLRALAAPADSQLVAAASGEPEFSQAEAGALAAAGMHCGERICPKEHLGNLFAAAAPVQVALAALLAARRGGAPVLAHCFGHGTEQAAFRLEAS